MKSFLERGSDIKQPPNNFKFYVSAGQELEDLNKSAEKVKFEKLKPKLLDHEIIITEGNRVLFFPNVADKTKGLSGNLYVTNFRFIFIAYEEDNYNEVDSLHQKNQLLGKHSACLTNIESLHQVFGEKKRKLCQDSQLSDRIKGLQILCKNMKVFTFNFDQSPITQGRNIAKTLLHHAFPGRHQLLFAYDFCGETRSHEKYTEGVVLFSERSEWENELSRTCSVSASNWRISSQNQSFQMSTTLPKWLIVPHSVLDCDFVTASQSFRCNRPPIWTWSSPNGAAIIRMADLLPTITDRTQENRMLENVRKCHPHLKGPCIKYLDKDLPSIGELLQSYLKLRDLCTPESHRQFKLQDSHLYSALENTKWLHYISCCLRVVVEAAQEIQQGITVVLQESDGRDTSAVISSLVQLVLDSHSRSIVGFQSLVQKEWIALGHPFCKRLGHLRNNNTEQSPVFLFFLDCVWQLQNQFPSSFEFTETYLTTLWDSVHISIFDTFLFDCEKDRTDAISSHNERLVPRSVWNWDFQFSKSDIELFINPLYKFSQFQNSHDKSTVKKENLVLLPEHSLPSINLWMQCYCRWLPLLSIRSGGRPQINIVHRKIINDIDVLLNDIHRFSEKNEGNCVCSTVVINNNNNNNNTSVTNNVKKNNFILSLIRKNGSSTSNSSNSDYNLLALKETNGKHFTTLLQNKNVIDNFYPFSSGSGTYISGSIANAGNFSEYDTDSVLNLTD